MVFRCRFMIASFRTLNWLKHRAGVRRLANARNQSSNRSLELNGAKGSKFTGDFGRREINGFVGFIDLIGFTTRVVGLAPSKMSDYLRPFLGGVTGRALKCGALVDKTLGDEVMFTIPDTDEDGGSSAVLGLRLFLDLLDRLQRDLGDNYPFRIGVAYGAQFVDRIQGNGYSEWTLIGESVNLAKRLQSLPGAEPKRFGGAFGALTKEATEEQFQNYLQQIAGSGGPLNYRIVADSGSLKGISRAHCAILFQDVSRKI